MSRISNLAAFALAILLASTLCVQAAPAPTWAQPGQDAPAPPQKIEKGSVDDRPWIGIYFESVPVLAAKKLSYPHETGIFLSRIIEGSPAEKAGLREGDIMYRFAGTVVKDEKHFLEIVGTLRPGDRIAAEVYRKGEERSLDLVLGSKADRVESLPVIGRYEEALKAQEKALEELADFYSRSYVTRGRIGLRLRDLNDDLASYFGVDPNEGVLVLDVDEEGAAERAGIKAGDVVVAVNGSPVSVSDDVASALGKVEPGDTVSLEIIRKGAKQTRAVVVEEALPQEYRKLVAPLEGIPAAPKEPEAPHKDRSRERDKR